MIAEEAEKLKFEAAIRAHERATRFEETANQSAVDSGTHTLKSFILINGGSCIAVLTFIGTLATKDRSVTQFATPLIAFAMGAGFAAIASALGYFTNLLIVGSSREMTRSYIEPFLQDTPQSIRFRTQGECVRWLAVGFATISMVGFFYGLCSAYSAFRYL